MTTSSTSTTMTVTSRRGGVVWTTPPVRRHRPAASLPEPPPPPPTPEQRQRDGARLRAEQHQTAVARARTLLLSVLTDEQRAEYEAHRYFHVISSEGRRFRIKHGREHNVFLVDDAGQEITEYCGHVGERVPHEDNILAQKLLLEHDEALYLRHANARHLRAA